MIEIKRLYFGLIFLGSITSGISVRCPLAEEPDRMFNCLGYITRAMYGAATQDVKILCSVARDVANCTHDQLGECLAAEVGRSVLNEVQILSEHCCPNRNHSLCPIRDEILSAQRCFALDSLVTLENGKEVSMDELQAGDRVLAYDDRTKQVIVTDVLTMLHRQTKEFAVFKQITTRSGQQLTLTPTHLLPTDVHGYLMAKDVQIGMNVFVFDNNQLLALETVSKIDTIIQLGFIAPLTNEGTLIVNNIATSCYATVHNHHLAHRILSPMRWWHRLFGVSNVSKEISGIHWYPNMLYELTKFFLPSIFDQ